MSDLRVLDLRADPDMDLSGVVRHVSQGGVVAYPTETVYGLGGACTEKGVAAVNAVKGRSGSKPLLALVAHEEWLRGLEWSEEARELATIFWPGSLTLVLRDPRGIFQAGVRDPGASTVAARISPNPVAERLVEGLGAPLTSTSLNLPGRAPARSGTEALRALEQMDAHDVWLLDAGTLPQSEPSTLVDCTRGTPIVLREGAVPRGRLRCVIPGIHG